MSQHEMKVGHAQIKKKKNWQIFIFIGALGLQ